MILVTGGAGLVGKELISQLLSKGESVMAIYNKTPLADFKSPNLQQFNCNILDVVGLEEIMQGIEQVYHCAAIVSFVPARQKEMFTINIEGTANIVNAALHAGVKKLVHVSSVAALGRIRENEPVTEQMNWTEETSNSKYGQSKYLGELEVWRGIAEGLDAVIVNPTIILGDGGWDAGSSQIFKTVYNEFPWYTEGITGFVDVRDVAKAMIGLMESNTSSQRFILSAANIGYRDVFNMIATAFNKKAPYKKVTPLLAKIVWRLEALKSRFTGNNPLITKETAATALAKVYFDSSKLPQFLPGFQYEDIQATIVHTCSRLQQKLNNS
jgi:nucleoside-diphosphate-sugar epimerase